MQREGTGSLEGSAEGASGRPDWYPDALDRLTDPVIVIGADGTVTYTNPFAEQIAGYERGSLQGTNMVEHLDPDDVERAIEVVSLVAADDLEVPVTPAMYRVRRTDGSYLPIEFNAVDLMGIEDGSTLLVGRYSGDRDVQDQLLGRLTSGEPVASAIELIPRYGLWRHPGDHYAVHYHDTAGDPVVVGDPLSVALAADLGQGMPWDLAGPEPLLYDIAGIRALSVELAERMEAAGLTCCWAFPVDDPLGTPACALVWAAGTRMPSHHRYALELMQRSLDLALRWRHQVLTLTEAAHRDPLTGLSNRAGFIAAIDELRAGAEVCEVALLYIDLDGFKAVNDRHGHRLGDEVLAEVGRRIASVVRPVDEVARLGGDEFAVLCVALHSIDDAIAVADRILEAVSRPVEAAGVVSHLGASIGIAAAELAGVDLDRLVHAADLTLYEAKRNGRNRWELRSSPV